MDMKKYQMVVLPQEEINQLVHRGTSVPDAADVVDDEDKVCIMRIFRSEKPQSVL